eukprot:6193469-Pleurochrysis_carterae.AAC.1
MTEHPPTHQITELQNRLQERAHDTSSACMPVQTYKHTYITRALAPRRRPSRARPHSPSRTHRPNRSRQALQGQPAPTPSAQTGPAGNATATGRCARKRPTRAHA